MALMDLPPGQMRDLQWSTNVHEMAVVLEGSVDFGVFGATEGLKNTLGLYDVAWTPINYVSYFENKGQTYRASPPF
jgi:hypothetical protein